MSLCPHCNAPFEPQDFNLPLPGGKSIALKTTLCPSCQASADAVQEADNRAAMARIKPLASLIPTPGGPVEVTCRLCETPFQAESTVFDGDSRVPRKTIFPTVCDACMEREKAATATVRPQASDEDRRRKLWVGMTGTRYSDFHHDELPKAIQPHAEAVLAWVMQPKGIGLIGPSRVGKSPLLYALGQRLFIAGHDVFPTSGIEFQRFYHRAFDKDASGWVNYLKTCEECEVLLLDDADKLNLTAGVEAEYYGMLETRRNWQRPVLCTLNLTGEEFAALGRDRSDRAAAIVERLRDLCEFIAVTA